VTPLTGAWREQRVGHEAGQPGAGHRDGQDPSFQLAPNDKAKELGKHVGGIATLSGAITSDGKG
jgi:hypothetical protein